MSASSVPELDLSTLRPKGNLKLRLMFDGAWKWPTRVGGAVVIGGVVAAFAVAYALSARSAERELQTATATIDSKDTYTTTQRVTDSRGRVTGIRNVTRFRISYTFRTATGRTVRGSANVTRERWVALKPGDKIPIEYLPSNPTVNRPFVARERTNESYLLALIPLGLWVGGGILLTIARRHANRIARLLTEGVLTQGVVEEKSERRDITINNRHPYSVRYRFSLPDGESRQKTELVADLRFAATAVPGGGIGVVYLPTDPDRSALFRDKWARLFESAGAS